MLFFVRPNKLRLENEVPTLSWKVFMNILQPIVKNAADRWKKSRYCCDTCGTLLVLLQGSNGSFRCKENAKGPYTVDACPLVYCLHKFSTCFFPANKWWKLNTRSTARCTTGIAPVAWLPPPIRSIFYNRLGIVIALLLLACIVICDSTLLLSFFGVWGGFRMGVAG